MEWTIRPWNAFLGGVGFLLAILLCVLTLKEGGIGWLADWKNWLAILTLSALGTLAAVWAKGGLAAGADWLCHQGEWVKTYELTEIKLGEPRSPGTLFLRDAESREFALSLLLLQGNPDLWNLVYNGMLHSVHHGGATVNDHARDRMLLDPRLHLVYDDDVEES